MPLYRFHRLDKMGRIVGLGEAVECVDDADAFKKAKQQAKGPTIIEGWDMGRRVAARNSPAINRRPRTSLRRRPPTSSSAPLARAPSVAPNRNH